jgi:hypothetical protein
MVRSEVFSPERVSVFQNIFDSAWEDLVTSGSPLTQYVNAEATRNALARHIIALGNTGLSPEEIKRAALRDVAQKS